MYHKEHFIYKPQVVLFGESITKWEKSAHWSRESMVHIIVGTSYQVSPFNWLSYENKSKQLEVFIINNEPIDYAGPCTQIIGDTSEILASLYKHVKMHP